MDDTIGFPDESGIPALSSTDDIPIHSTPIKGSKVPLPSTKNVVKQLAKKHSRRDEFLESESLLSICGSTENLPAKPPIGHTSRQTKKTTTYDQNKDRYDTLSWIGFKHLTGTTESLQDYKDLSNIDNLRPQLKHHPQDNAFHHDRPKSPSYITERDRIGKSTDLEDKKYRNSEKDTYRTIDDESKYRTRDSDLKYRSNENDKYRNNDSDLKCVNNDVAKYRTSENDVMSKYRNSDYSRHSGKSDYKYHEEKSDHKYHEELPKDKQTYNGASEYKQSDHVNEKLNSNDNAFARARLKNYSDNGSKADDNVYNMKTNDGKVTVITNRLGGDDRGVKFETRISHEFDSARQTRPGSPLSPLVGMSKQKSDRRQAHRNDEDTYGSEKKQRATFNTTTTSSKQNQSLCELENTTLQKQRQEIQLLMGELKDRDRELGDMAASHQQQLHAWEQDRHRLATLDKKLAQYEDELLSKTNQIVTYMNNLKAMKGKESQWLQEADDFRDTVQSQSRDIERLRSENDELKTNCSNLKNKIDGLTSKVNNLHEREAELVSTVKLKEKDISSATSQMADLSERLQQLDLRCKECKDQERAVVRERNDWKQRYEDLTEELRAMKVKLDRAQREACRLSDENRSARQQLSLVQCEANMVEKCKDELIDSIKIKQERTDSQLKNFRELYEDQVRKVSALQLQLDSSKEARNKQQNTSQEQSLTGSYQGRSSQNSDYYWEKSSTTDRQNHSDKPIHKEQDLSHHTQSSGYQSQLIENQHLSGVGNQPTHSRSHSGNQSPRYTTRHNQSRPLTSLEEHSHVNNSYVNKHSPRNTERYKSRLYGSEGNEKESRHLKPEMESERTRLIDRTQERKREQKLNKTDDPAKQRHSRYDARPFDQDISPSHRKHHQRQQIHSDKLTLNLQELPSHKIRNVRNSSPSSSKDSPNRDKVTYTSTPYTTNQDNLNSPVRKDGYIVEETEKTTHTEKTTKTYKVPDLNESYVPPENSAKSISTKTYKVPDVKESYSPSENSVKSNTASLRTSLDSELPSRAPSRNSDETRSLRFSHDFLTGGSNFDRYSYDSGRDSRQSMESGRTSHRESLRSRDSNNSRNNSSLKYEFQNGKIIEEEITESVTDKFSDRSPEKSDSNTWSVDQRTESRTESSDHATGSRATSTERTTEGRNIDRQSMEYTDKYESGNPSQSNSEYTNVSSKSYASGKYVDYNSNRRSSETELSEEIDNKYTFENKLSSFLEELDDIDDNIWDENPPSAIDVSTTSTGASSPASKLRKLLVESQQMIDSLERSTDSPVPSSQTDGQKNEKKPAEKS